MGWVLNRCIICKFEKYFFTLLLRNSQENYVYDSSSHMKCEVVRK